MLQLWHNKLISNPDHLEEISPRFALKTETGLDLALKSILPIIRNNPGLSKSPKPASPRFFLKKP
jgi:hypothetical protein